MKEYFLFTLSLGALFSLNSCTKIPSSILWTNPNFVSSKEDHAKQEVGSVNDSSCKRVLDKAMNNFDPELPVMGGDLEPLINIISQYQSCENVKRDDRIAEVLLKLLKRVQVLEGELSSIKGSDVSAGQ